LDRFTGRVLHSHDYRDARPFEDARVLVVGIGNSALDIAAELARFGCFWNNYYWKIE
jgi:putative flavoprotein involved in K+ transport